MFSIFYFHGVCGICGKISNDYICQKCKKRIQRYEKISFINKEHFRNLEASIYFDKILYYFRYEGLIRKILLQYKFLDKGYLCNMFANLIVNNKKTYDIIKKYDIIIPVPMDNKKERKRGYNQTELITKIISNKVSIYHGNNSIKKIKNTKTQSKLNFDQRKDNIKKAFSINNIDDIKNKNIILFDDICTTGSTVNEISKILKEYGAKEILVLVIAKD